MSVIIAIKENNIVYLAADSQVSYGASKATLTNPNNYKIWKTKGLEHSLMCHVGSCRDLGIVRLTNFIPETKALKGDIDFDFVQGEMIYNMFDALKEKGFTFTDSGGPYMTSTYLFAYKDKVYELSQYLYVMEIDDYIARGSGRDSALGSLAATIGEPVEIRLIKAIVAANNVDMYVGYPIIISDTETCQFKVYNEEDIKKLLNTDKISRTSKIMA